MDEATKIKGDPLWTTKETSGGEMLYGKEVPTEVKKLYKEDNLNEARETATEKVLFS